MRLLANTTSPYARIARVAMIEKGLDVEPTIVDPWADDPRLREVNAATRVPALVLDNGTALTESLLIVQWLERTRPAPQHPDLLGDDPAGALARAGIAMGVIDAAVHTLVIRKATAPVLFDDTPMGLRRRRTMAEGMSRLDEALARRPKAADGAPTLDAICAVVALDYLRFRFPDAPWLPALPAVEALAGSLAGRGSIVRTRPR